mmetsp:Transcript_27348/g.78683  ORF Transcript_27348/g.78683 Transcript_27348/m.78683 type:complete len:108 (+) Transcript_27348:455-778(+)
MHMTHTHTDTAISFIRLSLSRQSENQLCVRSVCRIKTHASCKHLLAIHPPTREARRVTQETDSPTRHVIKKNSCQSPMDQKVRSFFRGFFLLGFPLDFFRSARSVLT